MIRARKPQDDPELVRLIRSELIPLSATARPLDARMIRELPHRFRWGTTYVATRTKQGPPVAFVHFLNAGEELLVDMLATHSGHRGLGLGTLLMAYAEAYGSSNGCRVSRLYVDASNGGAQRFYGKLGYGCIRYIPDWHVFELAKPLQPLPQSAPISGARQEQEMFPAER
ncbi:GNAT family N-acetyltransferase [Paenibacillus agaridevorans]|uniref:GNAT family N-acetyltransferase n=1 Tax=Paenibacillus agaridevorans TaxID=171404 RepID=UPI001BE4563F|nr:GNAT family N-acetyltransferase [Paenibacillus agaridevorans]